MKKTILAAGSLLVALLGTAGGAWANLAANTQIINQAKLEYNDGSGLKTATASVTVTVAVVSAQPTITPGAAQSGSYNGPGTTLTDTFVVTANSNGPDTYAIAASVAGSSNTSGATATPTVASVTLGASVTTSGSTQTVIVVPSDGTSDGQVNGIAAGDTVVINGEQRTVQSVTDNASGTSTIVLSSALTNPAPAAGIPVLEQQTVSVTIGSGTITTSGTNITVTAAITVTPASSGAGTTSGTVLNTFTSGVASLTKYVRVVKAGAPSGTTVFNYGGNSYYQSGITAQPGEVLEYILVATNSGTAPVTAAVITDVLPTDYVTLKDSAYGVNREFTYVNDTGTTSTLSKAVDADAAKYDAAAGKITVNVGTGASNAAGGSIPGGNKSVMVLYQVTIKP